MSPQIASVAPRHDAWCPLVPERCCPTLKTASWCPGALVAAPGLVAQSLRCPEVPASLWDRFWNFFGTPLSLWDHFWYTLGHVGDICLFLWQLTLFPLNGHKSPSPSCPLVPGPWCPLGALKHVWGLRWYNLFTILNPEMLKNR